MLSLVVVWSCPWTGTCSHAGSTVCIFIFSHQHCWLLLYGQHFTVVWTTLYCCMVNRTLLTAQQSPTIWVFLKSRITLYLNINCCFWTLEQSALRVCVRSWIGFNRGYRLSLILAYYVDGTIVYLRRAWTCFNINLYLYAYRALLFWA